jgi:hypothetical protein
MTVGATGLERRVNCEQAYWNVTLSAVLMKCRFHNTAQIDGFESIHGVADGALPHPAFEPHVTIDDKHAYLLQHFGVKRGHTTYQVSKLAAQHNRALRLG